MHVVAADLPDVRYRVRTSELLTTAIEGLARLDARVVVAAGRVRLDQLGDGEQLTAQHRRLRSAPAQSTSANAAASPPLLCRVSMVLDSAAGWSLVSTAYRGHEFLGDLFERVHDDVGERERVLGGRKGRIGYGEYPQSGSGG